MGDSQVLQLHTFVNQRYQIHSNGGKPNADLYGAHTVRIFEQNYGVLFMRFIDLKIKQVLSIVHLSAPVTFQDKS